MSEEINKKRNKWIKRYLLFGGVSFMGIPLWELIIEELAFKQIDLLLPGECEFVIGVIHILILGVFHYSNKILYKEE